MSNKFDVKINPAFPHHASHGQGDAVRGHAVPGNLPRDGAGKRMTKIPVHGGMVKHTADGNYRAFGGDHASALDSGSGAIVPAARNVATPGWGNASARSGNPAATLHQAGAKRLTPVKAAWGQRSRTRDPEHGGKPGEAHTNAMRGGDHFMLADLGDAVLRNAFATADAQTQRAHGRGKDGSK